MVTETQALNVTVLNPESNGICVARWLTLGAKTVNYPGSYLTKSTAACTHLLRLSHKPSSRLEGRQVQRLLIVGADLTGAGEVVTPQPANFPLVGAHALTADSKGPMGFAVNQLRAGTYSAAAVDEAGSFWVAAEMAAGLPGSLCPPPANDTTACAPNWGTMIYNVALLQ